MADGTWRPAGLGLLAALLAGPALADPEQLRVRVDPNNLPFSKAKGEGFENKLAELVARDLGRQVAYTWQAERRGFVRNMLKAGRCDVVMGMPAGLDMVETTRPYYGSPCVSAYRADRGLDLSSTADPRLRDLKIGVHLIGNDGVNTPPAHAVGQEGIIANVVGYPIYGDYATLNPPARLIEAVERGDIDMAAVWGPFAGYFARSSPVPLTIAPITDTARFAPFIFRYHVAMAVKKGNHALKDRLLGGREHLPDDHPRRPNGMPAFGTVMPDPFVWDLAAYVKSLTKDPGPKFGLTVSPQSPKVEQVPAEFMETTHLWDYTEKFGDG